MATWEALARDSRKAAYEVFERTRWRTCVSRAYYAVYSGATHAALQAGVTMPEGRSNLSHARLPTIVGNNLNQLSHPVRWRLSSLVGELYKLRLTPDYMPNVEVDKDEARIALGMMRYAFDCLGGPS